MFKKKIHDVSFYGPCFKISKNAPETFDLLKLASEKNCFKLLWSSIGVTYILSELQYHCKQLTPSREVEVANEVSIPIGSIHYEKSVLKVRSKIVPKTKKPPRIKWNIDLKCVWNRDAIRRLGGYALEHPWNFYP